MTTPRCKLSGKQMAMLRKIGAGRGPWTGFRTKRLHHGAFTTFNSLLRRGLVTTAVRPLRFVLTNAGELHVARKEPR